MGSLVKSGRTEVTEKLRREVNKVVQGIRRAGCCRGGARSRVYRRGPHVGYRVLYLFQRVARVPNGADCDSGHQSWAVACTRNIGYCFSSRYTSGCSRSVCTYSINYIDTVFASS